VSAVSVPIENEEDDDERTTLASELFHLLSFYIMPSVSHDLTLVPLQISTKSPPVEDIPEGLIPLVDEVIKLAWTVDTRSRPAAADLLQHPSFQLLQCESVPLTIHFSAILEHAPSYE